MEKHIYEQLGININEKAMITFVGGGGKTSTIKALAQELQRLKKNVLITTTTHMYSSIIKYDFQPYVTVLWESIEGEKIKGPSPTIIDKIYLEEFYDFILVEGDGAKKKAIKAPEGFEPVIPRETRKTIGVIGIDSLDKPINEKYVHRSEIFAELTNKNLNDVIDINSIVEVVLNEKGIFKNAEGEMVLFLNKIENHRDIVLGKKIRQALKNEGFNKTVLGSIYMKKFY